MVEFMAIVVDIVVVDIPIEVDSQVVVVVIDIIGQGIIMPTLALLLIDCTTAPYLITFSYSFSPRTLDDAIKEDKLLTTNQFQYVKQGAEVEYEEYVKRHQQAYLERFHQKHSNEAW